MSRTKGKPTVGQVWGSRWIQPRVVEFVGQPVGGLPRRQVATTATTLGDRDLQIRSETPGASPVAQW